MIVAVVRCHVCDKLVFEVSEGIVEDHARMVREQMAGAPPLDGPVTVNLSWAVTGWPSSAALLPHEPKDTAQAEA